MVHLFSITFPTVIRRGKTQCSIRSLPEFFHSAKSCKARQKLNLLTKVNANKFIPRFNSLLPGHAQVCEKHLLSIIKNLKNKAI